MTTVNNCVCPGATFTTTAPFWTWLATSFFYGRFSFMNHQCSLANLHAFSDFQPPPPSARSYSAPRSIPEFCNEKMALISKRGAGRGSRSKAKLRWGAGRETPRPRPRPLPLPLPRPRPRSRRRAVCLGQGRHPAARPGPAPRPAMAGRPPEALAGAAPAPAGGGAGQERAVPAAVTAGGGRASPVTAGEQSRGHRGDPPAREERPGKGPAGEWRGLGAGRSVPSVVGNVKAHAAQEFARRAPSAPPCLSPRLWAVYALL